MSWQDKIWIVHSKQDTGYMEGHGQTDLDSTEMCPAPAQHGQ